jgi:hypothetical protein
MRGNTANRVQPMTDVDGVTGKVVASVESRK